ncbi:MAG: hypothetical protein NDI61_04730 [Bdellovibrionaceae bacterium]|nr:hypothetical protein [Pseudobdellovibrionaceae bacterium]
MRFFLRMTMALFVVGLVLLIFTFVLNRSSWRAARNQEASPVGQILNPSSPEAAPPAQPPVTESTHPSEMRPQMKPRQVPPSTEQPASR